MKILFLSRPEKVERYTGDRSVLEQCELVYASNWAPEAVPAEGLDAQILVADAIAPVGADLIRRMPNLKMIHSEGVAFNSFDIEEAARRGIYVCNCKGMNAPAVAEQAILLMLGLMKDVVKGDGDVRSGHQMDTKMSHMVNGSLRELGECTVGLVGFGDIARETALRLRPFGCRVLYNASHRHEPAEEAACGVSYAPLDELLASSDIVSLHLPVKQDTLHMCDEAFFDRMKEGALLINTSRGELVDQEALLSSLRSGRLGGAGLDTIEPEPVTEANPLITALREGDRILFSPHIGGITARSFYRGYEMIWEDIRKVAAGERPDHIVNGL